MKRRIKRILIDLIVLALGFLGLLSPFIFPQANSAATQGATFPIMISLIIVLCLFIVLFEAQTSLIDNKIMAFLGVLIAINAGLRFLENAIPGPAGFSPVFFLIILTGYFFGSRLGFLMGAMTLFVSALITGGVGPWLPGQMITAGWVGQSAALLKATVDIFKWEGRPIELILLSGFGAFWGFLFGAIMNLWFWPFLGAGQGQGFLQSAGFSQNVQRYTAYYLATSLIWDASRAVGNVIILAALSRPVLKILSRFKLRFSFQHREQSTT